MTTKISYILKPLPNMLFYKLKNATMKKGLNTNTTKSNPLF